MCARIMYILVTLHVLSQADHFAQCRRVLQQHDASAERHEGGWATLQRSARACDVGNLSLNAIVDAAVSRLFRLPWLAFARIQGGFVKAPTWTTVPWCWATATTGWPLAI
jgi:hypothetical protein